MRTKEDINEGIEALKQEKQLLEDGDNESDFIDMMNGSQPPLKIGYLTFYAGDVLKECDEIAFNCALNDYNDERLNDIESEIENLEQELNECEE